MKPLIRQKCLPLLLALLVSLGAVFTMQPAQARPHGEVEISVFYDALAPYGNWVDHGTYGRVWYPTHVPRGWRPYTDGHWVHTEDVGWLWVSDWEWGWAPFHYGRWAWDDWYGWVWVPGRVWAPAWVFWRYGGGYTAWAPMPPTVVWQPGVGVATQYFDWDRDLDRDCWVAVRDHDMTHRYMARDIIDPWRNSDIMPVTHQVNQIAYVNNVIVNPGVPVRHIERASGRRIEPVRIRELDDPFARSRHHFNHREVEIVRPRFRGSDPDEVHRERDRAEQVSRFNMARPRRDDSSGQERPGHSRQAQGPRIPERFQGKPRPDMQPVAAPGDAGDRQRDNFSGRDEQRPWQPGQDRGGLPGRRSESQQIQQEQGRPGDDRRGALMPEDDGRRGPGWQSPMRNRREADGSFRAPPNQPGMARQPFAPTDPDRGLEPQQGRDLDRQRRRADAEERQPDQDFTQQEGMRRQDMTSEPSRRQEQQRRMQDEGVRQMEMQRQQQMDQERRRQTQQMPGQYERRQQQEAARQAEMEQRQQAEMQRRQAEQSQRREEQIQQQREAARQMEMQQRQQAEMQRRQAEQFQRQQMQQQAMPVQGRPGGGQRWRDRMD